jgi:hypothetical protein
MSSRRMRELSVVLGLLLMVMLGAIAVVWATQGGVRTASTSTPTLGSSAPPTRAAGPATPSTNAPAPTSTSPATPTATPTATTTELATASPTADASTPPAPPTSSPTASPSPPPSQSPGVPLRQIEFLDVGLDTLSPSEEEPSVARTFTFVVEGPGPIETRVSDVSFGRVRLCMWRGTSDEPNEAECLTARNGGRITRSVASSEPQAWTVSLTGSQAGASPSADLRITWPTHDARMSLSGFRFQGEAIENYNGFTAQMDVATDGQLAIGASVDDGVGGAYPWLLEIEAAGGGAPAFVDEGNGSSVDSGTLVAAGASYTLTLSNRESVAEQRVLVDAELDWP